MQTSQPNEVAKVFNQFFVSIGEKLSSAFSKNVTNSYFISQQKQSFYLKPFTVHEVQKCITELDSSKSVRPGDPQIRFIKGLSVELIYKRDI